MIHTCIRAYTSMPWDIRHYEALRHASRYTRAYVDIGSRSCFSYVSIRPSVSTMRPEDICHNTLAYIHIVWVFTAFTMRPEDLRHNTHAFVHIVWGLKTCIYYEALSRTQSYTHHTHMHTYILAAWPASGPDTRQQKCWQGQGLVSTLCLIFDCMAIVFDICMKIVCLIFAWNLWCVWGGGRETTWQNQI